MVRTSRGRDTRWSGARAAVLAVVAVATGSTAHLDGGAALPSAGVLVALTCSLAVVLTPLLRHPPSVRRVVLLIVAGQAAIHLMLENLAPTTGDSTGRLATEVTATPGATMTGMTGMPGDPTGGHLLTLGGPTGFMVVAHLVAAACVGAWVAAGEQALWTLMELTLRPVVGAVLALVRGLRECRPSGPRVQRTTDGKAPTWHPRWEPASGAWTRRGPPSVRPDVRIRTLLV